MAFDCPSDGAGENEIRVGIVDPSGRSVGNAIKCGDDGFFTCEFTTTQVGEHHIEVIVAGEKLNVTPRSARLHVFALFQSRHNSYRVKTKTTKQTIRRK